MINLSQEIEALAQRLALAKHVSVEEAIRLALEEKVRAEGIASLQRPPRDQSIAAIGERRARTDRFIASLEAMPILDRRSPSEIMDDLNII